MRSKLSLHEAWAEVVHSAVGTQRRKYLWPRRVSPQRVRELALELDLEERLQLWCACCENDPRDAERGGAPSWQQGRYQEGAQVGPKVNDKP